MSYGIKSIGFTVFNLQEVGTFDEQYLRPWTTHYTAHEQRSLINAIDGAHQITPKGLSHVAHSIIKPAINPVAIAGISNGWQTRRFRFTATVRVTRLDNSEHYYELAGYTDHFGITNLGDNLDPNMVFHINSMTSIKIAEYRSPVGMQKVARVLDSLQTVSAPSQDSYAYTIRPQDLARKTQLFILTEDETQAAQHEISTAVDLTARIPSEGRLSWRTNQCASDMLTKALNPFYAHAFNPDGAGDKFNVIEGAVVDMREPEPSLEDLISFIQGSDRYSYTRNCSEVTWGELLTKAPYLNGIKQVMHLGMSERAGLDQPGMYESWATTTAETLFAHQLSLALPAILSNHFMQSVAFSISNRGSVGQAAMFAWMMPPVMSVPGLDDMRMAVAAQSRIEAEIFSISKANYITYDVSCFCAIDGVCRIKVSLEGGHEYNYCSPTYADGAYTPVLTNNEQHLVSMAGGISAIYDVLMDYASQPTTNTAMREAHIELSKY